MVLFMPNMQDNYKGKTMTSYWKGKHLTEEAKRKLSEAHKGKVGYWTGKKRGPMPQEWKDKISASNKGKPHPWVKCPITPLPEGTRRTFGDGYIEIKVNGEWIIEHRYVLERKLGRKLLKTEFAHHINETKDDNRPENLMPMNNGEHTTYHLTGKKHTEETKKRIGDSHRGKKYPERITWNKGLAGNYPETARNNMSDSRKRSIAEGRVVPWNKGKKGVSEETSKKMKDSRNRGIMERRIVPRNKGKKGVSEETSKKMSDAKNHAHERKQAERAMGAQAY